MRNVRKSLCLFTFLLLLISLFSLSLSAQGDKETTTVNGETLPEEYLSFLDELPEEIASLLPDELFSTDAKEVTGAVKEMSDFSFLLRTVLSLCGLELSSCIGMLASIFGLLILSSILGAVKASIGRADVARAFSFCATLVILITLITVGYETVQSVTSYFETLGALTSSLIPLLGSLYALGGNVGAAVASSSGLSVFMVLLEGFVGKTVIPFCGICLGFSALCALDPSLRLGTLLATVKKNYSTVLTFVMMLLVAMLSMQTTLGARADTLAMKSAKFAAGSFIPVVGGSVSELLRSVSAGISYLRGTVGICAVLLLLFTLFPTLVRLFLVRLTFQISASCADMLACDAEKKLLEEFASLSGYLIAAVSVCSSVLLLSLCLFIHCASAIG